MRTYLITKLIDGGATTEYEEIDATSIDEALMIAERAEAGRRTVACGIQPEDYAEATEAGIAFHEADGLLTE